MGEESRQRFSAAVVPYSQLDHSVWLRFATRDLRPDFIRDMPGQDTEVENGLFPTPSKLDLCSAPQQQGLAVFLLARVRTCLIGQSDSNTVM